MGQGFQPIWQDFADCIFLRASACGGAIENTAFARSAAGLKAVFLRVAGTGKVLRVGLQIEGGGRLHGLDWAPLSRVFLPGNNC